ncbi:MAG: hypothetical protein QW680_00035 [Pyrobaculum sp.]
MEDFEILSKAQIRGGAYVYVDEYVAEVEFREVHYWGIYRGKPSLYVYIKLPEVRELLKERSIWLNRWFNDVVRIKLEEKTAAFLAAFALYDRFVYRFEIDAGMQLVKEYTPDIPGGCIWADVGLPLFMWRTAYHAYHNLKFGGERKIYAEKVFEVLKSGF